jgi:hypothetical protein
MKSEKLTGILSNINKILRRKRATVKEADIFSISYNRANTIYNKLSYNQKKVVERLNTNLNSSKEFGINSVIGYSIMKYFITGDEWLFDNDDLAKLKTEIKKINTKFSQNSYGQDVNSIIVLIDDKELDAHNLVRVKNGISMLYKLVITNKISIYAAGKFANWYDKSDLTTESEQHKKFRKILNILFELKY